MQARLPPGARQGACEKAPAAPSTGPARGAGGGILRALYAPPTGATAPAAPERAWELPDESGLPGAAIVPSSRCGTLAILGDTWEGAASPRVPCPLPANVFPSRRGRAAKAAPGDTWRYLAILGAPPGSRRAPRRAMSDLCRTLSDLSRGYAGARAEPQGSPPAASALRPMVPGATSEQLRSTSEQRGPSDGLRDAASDRRRHRLPAASRSDAGRGAGSLRSAGSEALRSSFGVFRSLPTAPHATGSSSGSGARELGG